MAGFLTIEFFRHLFLLTCHKCGKVDNPISCLFSVIFYSLFSLLNLCYFYIKENFFFADNKENDWVHEKANFPKGKGAKLRA